MNILAMLWKNLWGGSRTMLFPARPAVTERYPGPGALRSRALHRLRHLQDSLHRRAPSSSRPARASSPGATIPANAPSADAASRAARRMRSARTPSVRPIYTDHRRVEELLHRRPQAARQAGRSGSGGCRRSKSRDPRHWRRKMTLTMTPLETISEKTGNHEPWVEKGGVHWLTLGAMKVRELATGDERAFTPASSPSPPISSQGRGLSPGVSLGPRRPVARLSLSACRQIHREHLRSLRGRGLDRARDSRRLCHRLSRAANTNRCFCARETRRA